MNLTVEQVSILAPDSGVESAGRKLGDARSWRSAGQSSDALWGECQGGALYQVRVDLSDFATRCSCPSRKFPCKHALGLLFLAAHSPSAVPQSTPPEWISEWLNKRADTRRKREENEVSESREQTAPVRTRSRTSDARTRQVSNGLDALDLWMNDLIRKGLASLETQSTSIWHQQAARMVDAKAQGIASRLRRMSEIPNSSQDWPRKLLDQLGRLALLSRAYRRLDDLPEPLREDVRQSIGWTLKQNEVMARGESVQDDWLVLGQRVSSDERIRTQWSWLLGIHTQRYALVLQFAAGRRSFAESIVPGSRQRAVLTYWPSAYPQRALFRERLETPAPVARRLPGFESFAEFLEEVSKATARQPWLERFPCVISDVVPVCSESGWLARDRTGDALPLVGHDHWKLLALSGGTPSDAAFEWDGYGLLPLGVYADDAYHLLERYE